jgi:hypothetical protein
MMIHSKPLILVTLLLLAIDALGEGSVYVEKGESKQVYLDDNNRIVYAKDEKGNQLPDFSYVGYHAGEKDIPEALVRVTLSPVDGDNTDRIQAALDKVGELPLGREGLRGAVLLKKGVYDIAGKLTIKHSGVVLRGEGNGPDGTVLVATGYGNAKYKRSLITVGNGDRAKVQHATKRAITDDYVPVGARTFAVASATGYEKGDHIVVFRPSTAEWIHAIGCDRLAPKWTRLLQSRWVREGESEPAGFYYRRPGLSREVRIAKKDDESWEEFEKRVPLKNNGKALDTTSQWKPGSYDFYFERRIVGVDRRNHLVTIDAPIVQALDAQYGGGAIYQVKTSNRVTEVGIEHLRLVSEFAKPTDDNPYGDPRKTTSSEDHGWNGIVINRNSENTWVRNVYGNYFGWSLISAKGLHATVQDCVNLGHASQISGGRRYPFMIDGQLNLMQRCIAVEGRHEFVVQARTLGPNVFVDCIGFDSKSSSGPHHRYAVGTLFDNVKSGHYMESRFRGSSGSGHGWAGAQTCFYNCIAPGFKVGTPTGAMSWVIGSGENASARVDPPSLYYQQLAERLGVEAVYRLTTREQLVHLGEYKWAEGRGE